jgi:AcrR family transcriptional regulator
VKCDDCFSFVRARKPDQIAQRRESILAAMAALLTEEKPEQISLNEVARRAGVAKSNIYRYFDSREGILLELLRADGLRWMELTEAALTPLHGSNDATAVAHVLARTTAAETRMCQLINMAAGVLEQNVSEQAVIDFKQHSFVLLGRLVLVLGQALPAATPDRLAGLMSLFVALISGLWPQSHPAELVRKALQQPGLALMQVDFEEALGRGMALLLRGVMDGGA